MATKKDGFVSAIEEIEIFRPFRCNYRLALMDW